MPVAQRPQLAWYKSMQHWLPAQHTLVRTSLDLQQHLHLLSGRKLASYSPYDCNVRGCQVKRPEEKLEPAGRRGGEKT